MGHVTWCMRSGRVRIVNSNQRETLYILNQERIGKVGNQPCTATVQGQKVKGQGHKVTRSRDVSEDKKAITQQCMHISTSNLVGIINVGVDTCGILSRSVGQANRK